MENHFTKILITLLVFLHKLTTLTSIQTNHQNIDQGTKNDLVSLLAIKSRISRDPQGVLASWNHSLDFCQWEGVICGFKHKRVAILDLSSKGLTGTLSPSIGNLTFLRHILLTNNTLHGPIPPHVAKLSRLQTLFLPNNNFTGVFPTNLSLCVNLVSLNLSQNNLEGQIPKDIGLLPRLKKLDFHQNHLRGDVKFIGNITSLEVLSASLNLLNGNIPDSFGELKHLKYINLENNSISGIIPPSFYNLSSLTELYLSNNQLEGSILQEFGYKFPWLQALHMGNNHFTGPLPISLSNLSKIEHIQMDSNEFTGKIRLDGRHLPRLQCLSLFDNHLGHGLGDKDGLDFIQSLVNCSRLQLLVIARNQLSGVLPSAVANLSTELKYLHIGTNNLSGTIPPGLGRLKKLILLELQFNKFTGVVPSDIGEIQSLLTLDLTSNGFYGTIPSSLGNISKLSKLYLSNNFFEGNIPSSLGRCEKLIILSLDYNNLSGNIPVDLFHAHSLSIGLYLSNNQLEGSLPAAIGELKNLALLDISNNKLSSDIPESLYSCTSLEKLYMQNNLFHGPIPSSFQEMKAIQTIDLSCNKLTGLIPRYFSTFSNMMSLNLSFNDLEGEVPVSGVFANESAVSLAGNSRLCGGILELHLPKCNLKSHRRKFSHILLLAIRIFCPLVSLFIITLLAILVFRKHKRVNQHSESPSKDPLLHVSYNTLLKATDGFSSANLIGHGSFAHVYKGILEPDHVTVAIKVFNLKHQAALKSFVAECDALRSIRHRNLLRIITACSSTDFQGKDFKALVYEFMPNGSLEKLLHSGSQILDEPKGTMSLGLFQRINIFIDVATAIDYLHNGCQMAVIHCDLKPSNILLNSDMTALVGDFGLARIHRQTPNVNESSSIGLRGTIGYASPEYGLGSFPSREGDVYSFGILMLEMMTGKRPTDQIFKEGLNLHTYAKTFTSSNITEILDPRLTEDYSYDGKSSWSDITTEAGNDCKMECLESLINIGIACSMEFPLDRMKIQEVVRELKSIRNILESNLKIR